MLKEFETNVQKQLQKFSEKLPHFSDGRIDYSKSKEALTIIVFVKYKDKILLLKRSDKVRTYKEKWNTIAGYLDEVEKPIEEKIYNELEEELGIERSNINNLKITRQYKIEDKKIKKTWLTYPTLVELIKNPKIKLDWEHSEFRWIKRNEIKNFDCVYKLAESLKKVL